MYRTRSQKRKKAKLSSETTFYSTKKLRYTDHTKILPDEMLIKIFSYLKHEELFRNVRGVCKRWFHLAATPILWKKISVDNRVPSNMLCKWIDNSPLLKSIILIDRNDVNTIAAKLSKNSPKLERLTIKNCWGSSTSRFIQGNPLCRMVKKCRKLTFFDFNNIRIKSTRLFELIGSKRSADKLTPCTYSGPVNSSQVYALVKAILKNDHYRICSLYAGKMRPLSLNLLSAPRARASIAARYLWDCIIRENALELGLNVD